MLSDEKMSILSINLYRASIVARNNAELLQSYSNAISNGIELNDDDIQLLTCGRDIQYHYTTLSIKD